jgi:double-stranded uracil-DNA glycosylase
MLVVRTVPSPVIGRGVARVVMCVMLVIHPRPRSGGPIEGPPLDDHIALVVAGPTTWLAERVNPSKADLEAARGRTIPDVLGPDLDVVFVGINPGLWSGAVGHHFARPGNRFWKALYRSGFTDRLLSPFEDASLLDRNLGVTNLVARTTARADDLSADEIRRGSVELEKRITPLRPRFVAVLGIGAYRTGFGRRDAALGPQEHDLGRSRLWVLPNPSGLNAHHQLEDLTERFRALRDAARELGEARDRSS